MAINKMAEVAKLLGVELGEEFSIAGVRITCRLSRDGFSYKDNDDQEWRLFSGDRLLDLIKGELEIQKRWRPKQHEDFFYVAWQYIDGKRSIRIVKTMFMDEAYHDCLNVDAGNCFRTFEEANAVKYEIYERLTGKEWTEVGGWLGWNNESV